MVWDKVTVIRLYISRKLVIGYNISMPQCQ